MNLILSVVHVLSNYMSSEMLKVLENTLFAWLYLILKLCVLESDDSGKFYSSIDNNIFSSWSHTHLVAHT